MKVQEAVECVSRLYGIETIFRYAKENNIEVSFYAINNKNLLILDSGKGNVQGELIMKQMIGDDIQGSYLDNQHISEYYGENFILLSLRNDLLPEKNGKISSFTEMMVIHELAHFIDQQKLQECCAIQLNDSDFLVGQKIENEANRIADRLGIFQDLVHNQTFGGILNHLIREKYRDLAPEYMKMSMSKTLIETDDIQFYSY